MAIAHITILGLITALITILGLIIALMMLPVHTITIHTLIEVDMVSIMGQVLDCSLIFKKV